MNPSLEKDDCHAPVLTGGVGSDKQPDVRGVPLRGHSKGTMVDPELDRPGQVHE